MFEANHQNGYANVTWLIAKWMKKKKVGTQRESLICYGQFVTRIAKRPGVLSDENKLAERLNGYKSLVELAMEQPSPVSVVDAFYTEDPPFNAEETLRL
nr:protein longifolia 2-like [Tanacetum cinerariifolium]